MKYSTRSTFASSLVLRGVCQLLFVVFVCAVCSTNYSVSNFVLLYTHFKSSLLAILTRYTRTSVSEVHVLDTWSSLRQMLATLTTIATPRCNEGVGMSGDVGRSLGPLFIVIFIYDSDAFYANTIHTILRLSVQRFCSARGVSNVTL